MCLQFVAIHVRDAAYMQEGLLTQHKIQRTQNKHDVQS